VPAKKARWDDGFLPPKLTRAIVDKTLEQHQNQKLQIIDRVSSRLSRYRGRQAIEGDYGTTVGRPNRKTG
jgi:hypothetical protein